MRCLSLCLAWPTIVCFACTQPAEPVSHEMESGALSFEDYHRLQEIETAFAALEDRYPRWFRRATLGTSVQGRQIPLLEVTDRESTGEKAAMWIDGAIHGMELGSAEPVLGFAERVRAGLVAGEPPSFLRSVVVYLVPVINVDARHISIEAPHVRQRNNLAPFDDDGDGQLDEDGPLDINGDGAIAMMRVLGKDGKSSRVWEGRDQDGDGRVSEDPPGGIDLNRNFPVPRGPNDKPATPLQPETEAIMKFWGEHPGIDLAVSYHTSANGFVLPPLPLSEEAQASFQPYLDLYSQGTGHTEISLPHTYYRGVSIEWFYLEHGTTAFIIELMVRGEPIERASDRLWIDGLGEVEIEVIEEGGSMLDGPSHIRKELKRVVREHVDTLWEMAELLASGV